MAGTIFSLTKLNLYAYPVRTPKSALYLWLALANQIAYVRTLFLASHWGRTRNFSVIELTPDWRKKRRGRCFRSKAEKQALMSEQDKRFRGTIYLIVARKIGKVYVGCSKNYKTRVEAHLSAMRKGKHHSRLLQAAFDLAGADGLSFAPVERNVDLNLLFQRERFWMIRMQGRLLNETEVFGSQFSEGHALEVGPCPIDLSVASDVHLLQEIARRGYYYGRGLTNKRAS